ncbi:MAG TPA: YsnF/AvaK domain-containing protein [Ktedonobacteraceae bacterium]|nr:YsnF/AvaK domain-containing protein [Ktedonobacteraceae bacterium]
MTTLNRSYVIAVFQDNNQAQQAIQDLLNAGFSRDQIRYSVSRGGGGIADDLTNMGVPRQEADYYNNEFQQGHTVVTVNTRDQQQQAYDLLTRDGGYDFNSSQGQRSNYGYGAQAATAGTATNTANTSGMPMGEETRDIKLRAEQLQPQTRWQQGGEVDLRKEVVSEQQTIDVPVTHEEVYIERRPGSGQVSDTPISDADEETVRVPVNEQEVDVRKQTVETGEVVVGKRQVQQNQQYTDTVQREELHVDRQGDVNLAGNRDLTDTDTDQNA